MTRVIDAAWRAEHPLPPIGGGLDKEARGTVLIVGGSATVPGAPLLTGEAALRVGAGKVQLGIVGDASAIGAVFPESAVTALPVDVAGEIAAIAAAALAPFTAACDVLVIGPGMRTSDETAALLEAVLDGLGDQATVVVDAGAMQALTSLKRGFANRPNACVITPHHGELAKLLDCDREEIAADPKHAAQKAATALHVVVAAKDETVFVVGPDNAVLQYRSKAPGLGTAGSGDVLAGAIGGLLARGCPPLQAAAWGVCLHGEAGRVAGQEIAAIGYLARDLLPFLARLTSLNSRVTHGDGE